MNLEEAFPHCRISLAQLADSQRFACGKNQVVEAVKLLEERLRRIRVADAEAMAFGVCKLRQRLVDPGLPPSATIRSPSMLMRPCPDTPEP